MKPRMLRVYTDTSVFGGVHDDAFDLTSRMFFDLVSKGRLRVVVSEAVEDELANAPALVRSVYRTLRTDAVEHVKVSRESLDLQHAYVEAKIVSPKWERDALHVAIATVAACPVIVSWNFKHIVNLRRIPMYNAVNVSHGYAAIEIRSPVEVIGYAEEGE